MPDSSHPFSPIAFAHCELPSGQSLRFIEMGAGLPMVFIHGLPGQATDFLPIMRRLNGDFRCIAYDRVGYGGSHRSSSLDDRTVDDNARELIAFLDQLGIDGCVLVGWSFGAHIAFDLAATHPDRVRALILLGGAGPAFDWPTALMDKILFRSGFGTALLKTLRRFGRGVFRSSLEDAYGGKMPNALLQSFHESLFVPGMIETWLHEGRTWDPSTSKASDVEHPMLMLHGDADTRVPIEVAEVLAARTKQAQLETLKDVGHWPFASHPDLVEEKCRAFLSALDHP